jgi:hypothetical protein
VLHELFSGAVPYQQSRDAIVYHYVCTGGRMVIPKAWPEALRELIAQCWTQDPQQRPSAADVVERLQKIRTELMD